MPMVEIPHKDYYEGILQLRNHSKKLLDWVLKKIRDDDRAAVTKMKKVTGGLDLYITSQKYLRILGKKLKERFVGEYKETRTLHTQEKTSGKGLYRVTILFREWPYTVGDEITLKGETLKILSLGNQIRVQNIETGKKFFIKPEDLKKARP